MLAPGSSVFQTPAPASLPCREPAATHPAPRSVAGDAWFCNPQAAW